MPTPKIETFAFKICIIQWNFHSYWKAEILTAVGSTIQLTIVKISVFWRQWKTYFQGVGFNFRGWHLSRSPLYDAHSWPRCDAFLCLDRDSNYPNRERVLAKIDQYITLFKPIVLNPQPLRRLLMN